MIILPSFEDEWPDGHRTKPRIQVLEIRHRDRPNDDPVAWLLIERREIYRCDERDNSIYEASISISYRRITARHSNFDGGKGNFDGSYSKSSNSVSLTSKSTSKGAVFLDLPGLEGQRIGTYFMNEIVRWVRRWPEATVNSIDLSSGNGHGENKERRNRFYEQFGLVFDYADPEHRAGHSRLMFASELINVDTWKQNITERGVFDYLAGILYEKERASSELESRNRACDCLIAERRQAEAKPIRWALKILYYRYAGLVVRGAILALLLMAVWSKFGA